MATWPQPVIPVFPAGYGPLPADFDTWVQDNFGGLAVGTMFRATLSTAQSLISGETVLAFNNVLEDNFGGWNATTHAYTVPWTGFYEVTVTVVVASQAVTVEGNVLISGTTLYEMSELGFSASNPGGTCSSLIVPCVGGVDFIQAEAFCTAAATAATGVGQLSSMEITFVSSQ